MRTKLFVAATVVLCATVGSTANAQRHGHSSHRGHGGHHGSHHRGHGLHLHWGGGSGHHYSSGHGLWHLGHSLSHLYFSSPYTYRSYSYYPSGSYYRPYSSYYNYYAPAELNYGPQAIKRFMGVDRGLGAPAVRATKPADVVPKVRTSNLASRQRAGRYRDLGDEMFRAQRYQDALERYKLAAKSAPDLAELYFRQGHAYIATSHYAQAIAVFKRGLAVDESWALSDFRLDTIYDDSRAAKSAHLESLAGVALANDDNSDVMFLLGLFLYYDGQAERSQKFFQRASELAGADKSHISHFLAKEEIKEADAKKEKKPALKT